MQLLSVTSEVLQLLVGLDESTGDPTSLFAGKFADVETISPQTLIDFLCQFSSVSSIRYRVEEKSIRPILGKLV